MKALSLFSGIGGLDLAAEWAGIRPVGFCEIDPFCRNVLKKHWPYVPVFNDILNLSGDDIGAVDIIYGGFPCQPFSVAGKQEGKSDDRYLWPEFSRLVGELKPRWVFAENVPGIIAIAADDVCADLERLGYEVGIWNFEAAAIGANHRRARVAFVAHLGDSKLHGSFTSSFGRINNKNDERCEEGANISPQFEGTCDEKNSDAVAHSRRELYAGGILGGTNKNKNREWNADQLKRPNSAPISLPDADHVRELQQKRCVGNVRGRTLNCGCDVSDSNSQRLEEQRDSITDRQKLPGAECGSRRSAEPRLGRVDDGLPGWLDRDWWSVEPDIPRVSKGIPDRVNRLKALGNAVVPAWAYPIFKAIKEADDI